MSKHTVSIADLAEVNPRTYVHVLKPDDLVSFIPMADVSEEGHWRGCQECKLKEVQSGYTAFVENDVLFAKITPCMENGKGAHVTGLKNGVGFGSTEFHVLRAQNGNDARFLFHWLQKEETRLRAIAYMGGSAGQQRVQPAFFSNYRIPFVEPSEQSRIAYVLDTIDEVITKTKAVIAKLKQIREGMLYGLLTYGLDEHGQIRDPVAHPEQFKDSPLGRIPKSWSITNLKHLCNHIGSGVTPRGGQNVYTKEGVLFIRSQNVTFEGLIFNDIACIPWHIHEAMRHSEVFDNDVLFNITGASIGRCCFMPCGLGPANVNQHVCILRIPNATEYDAIFLSTALGSSIGQKQVEMRNTFGNRQGLNFQQLGSFIVPWPNKRERYMISIQIKEIEDNILNEIYALKKVKFLKSGLQNDLLYGNVFVPEEAMIYDK